MTTFWCMLGVDLVSMQIQIRIQILVRLCRHKKLYFDMKILRVGNKSYNIAMY
jgi:hypothetical protein